MTLIDETRAVSQNRWKDILTQIGIDESFLKNEHGPCPLCRDGKDRFRWDDWEGSGSYYCNQCGNGSGIHLVQRFLGISCVEACKKIMALSGAAKVIQQKAQKTQEDTQRILAKIWREARPVTQGDPVWKYLESRCGDPTGFLQDIRYHSNLKHTIDGGTHPAMLARLVDWSAPKTIGIHRTYLTMDGRKASVDPVRMVLGETVPVRLAGPGTCLGIAEGIETAICAGKAFSLPVWAALNANGLKSWEPPNGTTGVVVFGDNDANFTGQDAAFSLAHRLSRLGLQVRVEIPPTVGTDWADVQIQAVA